MLVRSYAKAPILIALSGQARCGKSTVASMFEQLFIKHPLSELKYKPPCKLLSIATALKREVQNEYDLTHDQLYTDEKDILVKGRNKTPRQLLEQYADDIKTKHGDDHFIQITCNFIKLLDIPCTIIDDLRYLNEMKLLKINGSDMHSSE